MTRIFSDILCAEKNIDKNRRDGRICSTDEGSLSNYLVTNNFLRRISGEEDMDDPRIIERSKTI